jgi:hypothetical protein
MCLSGEESDRKRECVTVLVVFFFKKTVGTYCFKRKLLGPWYPQVSRLLLVFAWDRCKLRIHRKQVDNSIGSVICSKLSEDPHTFLVSCSLCCRCISLSTYIKCAEYYYGSNSACLKVSNSIAFDCFCKWIVFCRHVGSDGVFHLSIFLLWICDWCQPCDWFDVFKVKSLKLTEFFFGRSQIICR